LENSIAKYLWENCESNHSEVLINLEVVQAVYAGPLEYFLRLDNQIGQ